MDNRNSISNSANNVTKQEWDSYSSEVNRSVEKLKNEIGHTAQDFKEDWVYHSPKIKKRVKGVTNDLRHITENIKDRFTGDFS